jgi:hypothetical protein
MKFKRGLLRAGLIILMTASMTGCCVLVPGVGMCFPGGGGDGGGPGGGHEGGGGGGPGGGGGR